MRNALHRAVIDREAPINEREIDFVVRFFLELIEGKNLRIVPANASSEMVAASQRALDKGKRTTLAWVGERRKHRQRLVAAIDAAPDWRSGMREDATRRCRAAERSNSDPPKADGGDYGKET